MKSLDVRQMSIAAIMAAIMCVLGPFSIPVGPVPVSLTVLFIFFAVYLLGTKLGTISYLIYLLLGLVGLPVFTGFAGGPGKLLGPTGGYLVGGILTCIVSGLIIEKSGGSLVKEISGMILGLIILYIFGSTWLSIQAGMNFSQAVMTGVIPFIIFDIIKIIAALVLGRALRSRLQGVIDRSIKKDDKAGTGKRVF